MVFNSVIEVYSNFEEISTPSRIENCTSKK